MVFSNNFSNQDSNLSNRNDNSSHKNNKAHKEAMSLRWTSMTTFLFDSLIKGPVLGLSFMEYIVVDFLSAHT